MQIVNHMGGNYSLFTRLQLFLPCVVICVIFHFQPVLKMLDLNCEFYFGSGFGELLHLVRQEVG